MKAGEIEFYDDKTIKSLVTIGDDERDAVIRTEEFVREFFGDKAFVGNLNETRAVGSNAKGTLYKVIGY